MFKNLLLSLTLLTLPCFSQQITIGGTPFTGLHLNNAETATYQVLASDFSACKTITVASGTFTITLVASTAQPINGQCVTIVNYGTGVITVARSGQNLNGGTTSLTLAAGSATAPTSVFIWSDGTNYEAVVAGGSSGGGSGTVNSATQYDLGVYATTGTAISGSTHITTDANGDLNVTVAAANTQGVISATDTVTGNVFNIEPSYNGEVGLVTTQNIVLISTSNSATVQGFQASLSGQGGGSQLQDNGISGVTADDNAGGANIKITMGGSVAYPIIAKTTTFAMTVVNSTILANATSAAFTVSLPTAPNVGEIAIVKKTDSSINAVTVSAGGTIHIDGSTTYSLATQYKYVQVQWDGTLWDVIANN